MAERDVLALLATARIAVPAHDVRGDRHITLRLGDQTGILLPDNTEQLCDAVLDRVPPGTAGFVVGSGVVEILLGYLLARRTSLALGSVAKTDGRVVTSGRFPSNRAATLLCTVLDDQDTINEFVAGCRDENCHAVGVIALVDRLPGPDQRVAALTSWADHTYHADECPLCNGS